MDFAAHVLAAAAQANAASDRNKDQPPAKTTTQTRPKKKKEQGCVAQAIGDEGTNVDMETNETESAVNSELPPCP